MSKYTLRRTSQLLGHYADSREPLDRSQPWALCRDSLAIADTTEAPAALVKALADVNALPAPDASENPTFALATSTDISPSSACAMAWVLKLPEYLPASHRGDIEMCVGAGQGEELRPVSILAGDTAAPTLASYLHRKYGTAPAEKPAPPAPPTPEELAEIERQRKRHDVLRAIASILFGDVRDTAKAGRLLANLDAWQALQ
ncbi:MAG TPA: hypothetical protein VFC78_18555 [Tepidisphaeraceae bacterium]|nr:hypothetical protein [Tepidisphaeraceae bacterium]